MFKSKLFLSTFAAVLLFSVTSYGTIHNITIGNNFFSPLGTTVQYGDTVRWSWDGGLPHSSTSDVSSAKSWDSGVSSLAGFSFEIVISAIDGLGSFPYHCSIHTLTMKDTIWVDNDSDGFTADNDCHDGDPTIFPGAPEIPDDLIDQDCNGIDAVTCFVDNDHDGYGSFTTSISLNGLCDALGLSDNNFDCHDNDPGINPGATDIPNDGIDQDCDGADATTCCVGIRGNIDGDINDIIDIEDLVYMVDYQFRSGPAPTCPEEADLDSPEDPPLIDVGDLVFMVDYQFRSGATPPACP